MNGNNQRRAYSVKRAVVAPLAVAMLLSVCGPGLTAWAEQVDRPQTTGESQKEEQSMVENIEKNDESSDTETTSAALVEEDTSEATGTDESSGTDESPDTGESTGTDNAVDTDESTDASEESSEEAEVSDEISEEPLEPDTSAVYETFLEIFQELDKEAADLDATQEDLDTFYYDRFLTAWDDAQLKWEEGLLTNGQIDEINRRAQCIVEYLETEFHYTDGKLVLYGTSGRLDNDIKTEEGSGIKFKLFDYTWEINKYRNALQAYFNFRGTKMDEEHHAYIPEMNLTYDVDGYTVNHATVEHVLGSNGSPVLELEKNTLGESRGDPGVSAEDRNLGFLFGSSIPGYVIAYSPSNTLLQYDISSNHYYYDSKDNAVDYDKYENVFRVRNYVENTQTTAGYPGYYDFLPFNYTEGNKVGDSAYNVALEDVNYWFGMTMEVEFYMPKDGKINGKDMTFHFSGDDDVWVFIDDVLVLDLGGTHGTVDGEINFATGKIKQYLSWAGGTEDSKPTSFATSLEKRFAEASRTPNNGWGSNGSEDDDAIFKDYTKHRLKFFYLERGAAVANCSLNFNLPTLPDNTLQIGKELAIGEAAAADSPVKDYLDANLNYQFRIWECDANGNIAPGAEPLFKGHNYIIKKDGAVTTSGTVDADGMITLKAGQLAVFENMLATYPELKHYRVEEILPDNLKGQYADIEFEINGGAGSGISVQPTAGKENHTSYFSSVITIDEENNETSATVMYTNRVDINKLSMLEITKAIRAGSVSTTEQFPITVTLDGVAVEAGTQYIVNGDAGDIRTVEAGGIIRLADGETATLVKGIISGTQFSVTEVLTGDMASTWNASYSGTVSTGTEETTLSGTTEISDTFPLNSRVHVTVTNQSYDFNCKIPVTKTYVGNTSGRKDFTFAMRDSTGNVVEGAETTITVNSDRPATGAIVLGFQSSASGEYTYKLYEVVDSTDRSTNYDTSVYTVVVNVSENNGTKEASIQSITRDGQAFDTADFTNYKATNVAVTKTVTGNMGDHSQNFTFTASMDGIPMVGVQYQKYALKEDGEYAEAADGFGTIDTETFAFQLKHGEKLVFSGIRIGAAMTITEEDTSYEESVDVTGSENTSGNNHEARFSVAVDGNTAAFTNSNDVNVETGITGNSFPMDILISTAIVFSAILIADKRRYFGRF